MMCSARVLARTFPVLAAMAFALGGSGPAEAVSARVKKACVGDYKRLCPQYKVGSAQLRACMEAKQAEISWNCVQALIDSGEVDRSRSARR